MLKLVLNSQESSLMRSHNSFKGISFREMSSVICDNIRQGSTLHIVSDNTKPQPHRGTYYMLYMQEFKTVYLFYLDVNCNLRVVNSGYMGNAVEYIYRNLANDSEVVVLKSDGKRAYRVVTALDMENEKFEVQSFTYKNKSSQKISQVYMSFFDAINYAVACHAQHKRTPYYVISPKKTVMFEVK